MKSTYRNKDHRPHIPIDPLFPAAHRNPLPKYVFFFLNSTSAIRKKFHTKSKRNPSTLLYKTHHNSWLTHQNPILNHKTHLSKHPNSSKMGLVFGKIAVETPNFELIKSTDDYEIRKYSPSVIAEVTYDPTHFKGNKDGGFMILANYIGAVGNPQNSTPEKIAMTAQVITQSSPEKIPMTAPVVTKEVEDKEKKMMTMQFILREKYRKAEEAPRPVDESVVIREEGERKYGVVKFGGVATEEVVVVKKVEELRRGLERDGYKVIGEFLVARYNPPWTLPAFRTNEVLLPIE